MQCYENERAAVELGEGIFHPVVTSCKIPGRKCDFPRWNSVMKST